MLDLTKGTGEELIATVFAFSPVLGDFQAVEAVRRDRDVYELRSDAGDGHLAGDLVRCELSDGELIVKERVFRARLI
jgi:hypothetical protein